MLDAFDLLDKSLFKTINHAGSELLDGPMIFISKGSSWLFLYVAFIYLFYKKWGKKSWIPILTLLTAVGVSDRFSSGVLKPQVKRERPCKVEALQARTPSGCNSPYGFVSSHASNHAVLAFFVIATLQPPTLISTLLIFWVILIAFSRVYLGVHYPGDVLAGMLLGSFIAWIFVWFHKKLLHRFSVNSHL